MEVLSQKIQNQIIAKRLYESGFDAKAILNLNIEGLIGVLSMIK